MNVDVDAGSIANVVATLPGIERLIIELAFIIFTAVVLFLFIDNKFNLISRKESRMIDTLQVFYQVNRELLDAKKAFEGTLFKRLRPEIRVFLRAQREVCPVFFRVVKLGAELHLRDYIAENNVIQKAYMSSVKGQRDILISDILEAYEDATIDLFQTSCTNNGVMIDNKVVNDVVADFVDMFLSLFLEEVYSYCVSVVQIYAKYSARVKDKESRDVLLDSQKKEYEGKLVKIASPDILKTFR